MVATLLWVLLATMFLAGLSYWLGMQSAGRPVDFRPVDFWNDFRIAPAAKEPPAPRAVVVQPLPAPGVQRAAEGTALTPAVSPPGVRQSVVNPPTASPPPAPVELPAQPRLRPTRPPPAPSLPAEAGPNPRATAAPAVQSSPSFNCRLARTRGEIAVCSSGELAALDRDLAALSSQALKRADAARRTQLLLTRDRFLTRREVCASDPCTSALYADRISEVRTIMGWLVSKPSAVSAQPPQARAAAKPQVSQPPVRPPPKPQVPQRQALAPAGTLDPKSRASFSCRFARTRGEITVCNSAELGKLDRQLAVLYGLSWGRADAAKRARLLRARDRFLAQREACRSEVCVNALYVARMREVSATLSGARPPP
jgi:uncharacterized protein